MLYDIFCIILLPLLGTSLGALFVYSVHCRIFKNSPLINGFCAGIMTCSALVMTFSSLTFDLESTTNCFTGLVSGALLIALVEYTNKCFEKNHSSKASNSLITAIILHNIPEGIAVGAAAGAVISSGDVDNMPVFAAMSIGIAIQNIPEGAIVSLPLLKKGMCKRKAFAAGVLSGAVEPLAAFVTMLLFAGLCSYSELITSCASGAMLYVCFFNLVPEGMSESKKCTFLYFSVGFLIMLLLDLTL